MEHERYESARPAQQEPCDWDTYVVPPEILQQIPAVFYTALAGELFAIYGPSAFVPDEDGVREYRYHTGSFGWDAAIWMACKKCDLKWLFEYYEKLEWFESDRFDAEICDRLEELLTAGWPGHDYFMYLYNYRLEEESGYPRWMN